MTWTPPLNGCACRDSPRPRSVPNVKPASITSIAVTAPDILLTLGVVRTVIDPATLLPNGAVFAEWTATYALSATAADLLYEALGTALKKYADTFGAIPRDPSAKIDIKGS